MDYSYPLYNEHLTESHKDFILEVLAKIKDEHHDHYRVYKDIYDILQETPGCRIPFDNLLSNKCQLLNFVKDKMNHSEALGKLHVRLINVMRGIEPVRVGERKAIHILTVFNSHEKYNDYLKARPQNCGNDSVEASCDGYYLVKKRPVATSNEDNGAVDSETESIVSQSLKSNKKPNGGC